MSRVLYVDDEPTNLLVFEAAYEDDFEVFTALSASAALGILEAEPIDLVITDQRMPGMTGVELLERLDNDQSDHVRMILTGYSDIDSLIRAINTGRLDQYVTKPYDVESLRVTMKRALEVQAVERRNRSLRSELEAAARRAEAIREAFQKYVPPPVVDTLLESPDQAESMVGESRVVAVLFARIQDFQRLVLEAGWPPEAVVEFLNAFFTEMDAAIIDHGGMLASLVGDELLAVFGAPRPSDTPESDAAAASVAMLEALDRFNEAHAIPRLGAPVRIGIGLNRGPVVVGNIGGRRKMQYGVVGDTVNVASRIQGLTSRDRDEVLASASVAGQLSGTFETRAMGPVTVKGKAEPVDVVRILGRS